MIDLNGTEKNILNDVIDMLGRASVDKKFAMRNMVLSTCGKSGVPESRMVVLRKLILQKDDRFALAVYTDKRSSKVDDIKDNSFVSLCFWDPGRSIQIRLKCSATVIEAGDFYLEHLQKISGRAQESYTTKHKPGSPLGASGVELFDFDEQNFFCLILLNPFEVDLLKLGSEHVRFIWKLDQNTSSNWKGGRVIP
ncbi:MAG: pyridoxamine 5'-phosphate oxidase family protein [Balneolales bacterium]|nr:pyridoxamine 5'-phosphate oxidase family protein [Balneolales bacterium]